MRYLIAVLALLCATPAFAHGFWWLRVAQYADGRPIVPSDGTVSYRVEWTDGNEDFSVLEGSRTTTAASVQMPDPVGLLRCYRVVAVLAGVDSDPSGTWCKDMRISAPPLVLKPSAPTGIGGD